MAYEFPDRGKGNGHSDYIRLQTSFITVSDASHAHTHLKPQPRVHTLYVGGENNYHELSKNSMDYLIIVDTTI
jgi:hypothetical protein